MLLKIPLIRQPLFCPTSSTWQWRLQYLPGVPQSSRRRNRWDELCKQRHLDLLDQRCLSGHDLLGTPEPQAYYQEAGSPKFTPAIRSDVRPRARTLRHSDGEDASSRNIAL